MNAPEIGRPASRVGGFLLGFGAVLLVLGALVLYGVRLHRRLLLDSADPGRQRARLLEAVGAEKPPEGWRIGRAFDLRGERLLLFEGLAGNPPVSVTAFLEGDSGKAVSETWIRAEEPPPAGAAFGLRGVRRGSRGTLPTPAGGVPYAVIAG